jgi:hypothetical protein
VEINTLGPLKVRTDRRRTAQRSPGGLGDQLAHHRCPFARDVPESIPVARLVLARNEAEKPADGLGMREAMRIVDEGRHSCRRANAKESLHAILIPWVGQRRAWDYTVGGVGAIGRVGAVSALARERSQPAARRNNTTIDRSRWSSEESSP